MKVGENHKSGSYLTNSELVNRVLHILGLGGDGGLREGRGLAQSLSQTGYLCKGSQGSLM